MRRTQLASMIFMGVLMTCSVTLLGGTQDRNDSSDVVENEASMSYPDAMRTLRKATGETQLDDLCQCIAKLRSAAKPNSEVESTLVELLPEQSAIYQNRIRSEVILIRGALFVTLAKVGPSDKCLPFVKAELATTKDAYTFGACCRLAGALGVAAANVRTEMLRVLGPNIHDELFSLDDPQQRTPLRNPTTAQLEAVKALLKMGPANEEVRKAMEALVENRGISDVTNPRQIQELAKQVLAVQGQVGQDCGACQCQSNSNPFISPWLDDSSSRRSTNLDEVLFSTQFDRSMSFQDLAGRPVFLSYFYSSCDNPQKCSRTVSKAGQLQKRIRQELGSEVTIALLTLDPVIDDSRKLTQFGQLRRFDFDDRSMMIRMDQKKLEFVSQQLELPVSFNHGRLNVHGVGAVLLDKHGRIARIYHSVFWDNDQVLSDLKLLMAEE